MIFYPIHFELNNYPKVMFGRRATYIKLMFLAYLVEFLKWVNN
jgi:hypothetical protein